MGKMTLLMSAISLQLERVLNHVLLCFSLPFFVVANLQVATKSRINNKVKWMYDRGDYDGLRDSLKEVHWNCLLNDGLSVDEVWSEIVNKINNGIDKFVLQRNTSGRSVHQRKTVSHTVLTT